ncbi:MAG: hypothetical protein V3T77_05550, partial [Planctomycetota bacterium]
RAAQALSSLREWGGSGWQIPFTLTFHSSFSSVARYDGVLGPVFLVGVPLVLLAIWRRREVRSSAALMGLLMVAWLVTTRQIRFLIPALSLMSILIVCGGETFADPRARRWARSLVVVGVLLTVPSLLRLFCLDAPLAYAVGVEGEEQFRERRVPGGDYKLFRELPEMVPEHGRILFGASGHPPVYYIRSRFHIDSVVENYTLRQLLAQGKDPAGVAQTFAREQYTHLLFRFSLVFGKPGVCDLTLSEQLLLRNFLNEYGKQLLKQGETVLYQIQGPRGRAK